MDLPQIGAHCSLPTCNALDFLPTTCKCAQSFCANHIPADQHACPLLTANIVTTNPTFSDQLPRCELRGCEKLSLRINNGTQNESCNACNKSFCVDHRHPETHECPSIPTHKESINNTKAYKPVAKLFKLARKKPPTDPVKLAQWQKVEIMKMRHKAIPADPKDKTASLPPDQRLHVRIMIEENEHIFWLRKAIVTGRALDLIMKQLDLRFPEKQMKFCMVSQGEDQPNNVYLHNDQVLASQVMDGCTLLLSPVDS